MTEHALPAGYRFAAVASGIKKSNKLDMALIVSDSPAQCAGVFTRNRVIAAPLLVTRPRIATGQCQAILVNSGNANACTGAEGVAAAEQTVALTAAALAIDTDLVAVSSTGVIGVPLPLSPFERAISQLVAALCPDQAEAVARAMITTDAFTKIASAKEQGDNPYSILGLAKGAGMIHPDMATMLCFVLTDARIDSAFLQELLDSAVADSFNSITVDGDTSTNDTVLLLANGAAGGRLICPGSEEAAVFANHLNRVMLDLAKMIVSDGEGATKMVQIKVVGAKDAHAARIAARSVATSALVKTAFFGEDANWGRIIAAVGYSGIDLDQSCIDICFDHVPIVANGVAIGPDNEAQAGDILKKQNFVVTIDLHLGAGEASYYTSDLNYEYVKINASYRT
ncbi:MAG: bifunctional glutamate N-acetyltransferase/amino-acid acetyltransferase ArgJ [Desulfuromonadales bacterium]|nr:bifunctional glutamate N-acetyltransferase/amino-acid acetyltransferase ArgJ [Desulfuromonadales bacterium]